MVLSLCGALGLHWAALQSVAWAGMLVSYSRTDSVASAFAHTFDGRHPCALCKAIASTEKQQQGAGKQGWQHGPARIDMLCTREPVFLHPPCAAGTWPRQAEWALAFSPEPILLPPRSC